MPQPNRPPNLSRNRSFQPSSVALCSEQFEQQTDIVFLRIPRVTERIGGTFGGFTNLRRILFASTPNPFEVDSNLRQFDEYCFRNCPSLEQVLVPKSVHTISCGAFANCGQLRTVLIEHRSMLSTIGKDAFRNCHQLVDFQSENAQSLTNIGDNAFSECLSLEQFTIYSGIVRIGNDAFSDCLKLAKLDILQRPMDYFAAAVTANGGNTTTQLTIGKNAFRMCRKLQTVDFQHVKLEHVDTLAFGGCVELVHINRLQGIVAESVFYGCGSVQSLTDCGSLLSIYPSIFDNRNNCDNCDNRFPRFSFESDTVVILLDTGLIRRDTILDCLTMSMPEWLTRLNTDEFEQSTRDNLTAVIDVPTLVITDVPPGSRFTLRRSVVHITTQADAKTNAIICGKYKHPDMILPIRFGVRIVSDNIVYPDTL